MAAAMVETSRALQAEAGKVTEICVERRARRDGRMTGMLDEDWTIRKIWPLYLAAFILGCMLGW